MNSIPFTFLIVVLAILASTAYANAFIPTMVSANALWVVALPLVVGIEGWLMASWNWQRPYRNSLNGNLLSLLAAIPIGVGLTIAGGYLDSRETNPYLSFMSNAVRDFLVQVFLYGQTPSPSYGFIGFSRGGIYLAALLFMGICWLLTFAVEGFYYTRMNPLLPKGSVYKRTALVNISSYGLLALLWFPYSYFSASAGQDDLRRLCSYSNSWSDQCHQIWSRFPETLQSRLESCNRREIQRDKCLTGPN